MKPIRLQKLIAQATELSRRSAEEVILAGRVSVNGKIVQKLGTTVMEGKDHVRLDNKLLQAPTTRIYIAFNKPSRVLVTKSDPEGRDTIWKAIPRWEKRLNTAGRLDYDAEGLILLSDDGEFLHRLSHPKFEIWKIYRVQVKGVLSHDVLRTLAEGVKLDDGITAPAKVKVVKREETHSWLQISIREGRNRQLKRMCEAIGHPVIKLKRYAIGPVRLGKLKSGDWRFLTRPELSALKKQFRRSSAR